MSKSITKRLFKQYTILLSTVFILFIIVVMWSLKFSYYQAMEHTLENVIDKVEKKITSAYFSGNKHIELKKTDSPFIIQVYEYINGQYKLMVESNYNKILPPTLEVHEGFHVEVLKNLDKQQYYAEYDKTFEVYKHKYHILVITSLYTFLDTQKEFFMWILLLGTILYTTALFLGYRYINKMIKPIHKMINTTSSISSNNFKKRLPLPKIKDEFYTLSQTINAMLERLDKTLMSTKRFNAKVSHELKTPLTIMRGEIEVALFRERSSIEYKELLYSTLEEIDTLQAITENMLLLTKIDFQTLHIKKLNVRFDKLIEEAISSCHMQFEAKSIKINSSLEHISYLMEEILIKQSIKNLINNAIKYSPSDTSIKIILKKEGEKIRFEIHDEGFGISDKDMKHLFEPSFRSDNRALELISGDGLGLTIVYHTMLLHNAKLTVKSTLGAGSTFIILF